MGNQYDGLPEYNLGEPEDMAFFQSVPELCRACPVLHDLVIDYVMAGMMRTRMLNMGEHMMSGEISQTRREILAEQRLAMERRGIHISDQDLERLADRFDQQRRHDIAELIDDKDHEIEAIQTTITAVHTYCDGPMNLKANRHGIAHTALICTSPIENIRSNSARIDHEFTEE